MQNPNLILKILPNQLIGRVRTVIMTTTADQLSALVASKVKHNKTKFK